MMKILKQNRGHFSSAIISSAVFGFGAMHIINYVFLFLCVLLISVKTGTFACFILQYKSGFPPIQITVSTIKLNYSDGEGFKYYEIFWFSSLMKY